MTKVFKKISHAFILLSCLLLIIGGGFYLLTVFVNIRLIEDEIKNLTDLSTSIHKSYEKDNAYKNMNNEKAIKSGIVPKNWKTDLTKNTITNRYGGAVKIEAISKPIEGQIITQHTYNAYKITFDNISGAECAILETGIAHHFLEYDINRTIIREYPKLAPKPHEIYWNFCVPIGNTLVVYGF